MYANFRSRSSYTDTCDAIIMYCMSLFVVNNVVYKQISMTSLFGWQISTFLQNFITQSLDDATIEEGDEHRSQISGAPMASMMCVDNPETSREIICVAPAEGEKPLTIMTLKRCLILISFPLLMVGLKILPIGNSSWQRFSSTHAWQHKISHSFHTCTLWGIGTLPEPSTQSLYCCLCEV